MSTKEACLRQLQAQLSEWKAEIDKLKARAHNAEADARTECHEQIENLKTKQEAAMKKREELQHAGEEAWEDLKAGIKSVWHELGEAVKSTASKLK